MMTINKIAQTFAEYFKNFDIKLPKEALVKMEKGNIDKQGWHISYTFNSDEQGDYLDFHASHRMTNARHCRIRENGELEGLPSYREFYGFSKNATKEEKKEAEEEFYRHNREVGKELRRKGLE